MLLQPAGRPRITRFKGLACRFLSHPVNIVQSPGTVNYVHPDEKAVLFPGRTRTILSFRERGRWFAWCSQKLMPGPLVLVLEFEWRRL